MNREVDDLATKYLLGELAENETRRLEEDYFTNDSSFEAVLAVENDLIDSYSLNELSEDDRTRFEERLLLNPQQRRRVSFANMLTDYSSSQSRSIIQTVSVPERSSPASRLLQLLTAKPMFSMGLAVAVLMVSIAAVWFSVVKDKSEPVEQTVAIHLPDQNPNAEVSNNLNGTDRDNEIHPNVATSEKPDRARKPQAEIDRNVNTRTPRMIAFVLSPGSTRGGSLGQKFTVPTDADTVRFQLKYERQAFSTYSVRLETAEGRQVWSNNQLNTSKGSTTLNIQIPAKRLKSSDYILTLSGITARGVFEKVEEYSFSIVP